MVFITIITVARTVLLCWERYNSAIVRYTWSYMSHLAPPGERSRMTLNTGISPLYQVCTDVTG